jgi:hypothetical protein
MLNGQVFECAGYQGGAAKKKRISDQLVYKSFSRSVDQLIGLTLVGFGGPPDLATLFTSSMGAYLMAKSTVSATNSMSLEKPLMATSLACEVRARAYMAVSECGSTANSSQ